MAARRRRPGADAVSLINTLKGMASTRDGRGLARRRQGGVSGPAVRAVALQQVYAVAARVDDPGDRHGGHPERARRASTSCRPGATGVAVGTESFRDPGAGRRIAAELAALEAREWQIAALPHLPR